MMKLLTHCLRWLSAIKGGDCPSYLTGFAIKGKPWSKKRVERVYNMLKLNLRRKGKRRVPTRTPEPLSVPRQHNESWSMDFMSDALSYGHRFRTLNILDDFNRQALAIEVDTS
ncbi:hypothetical protein [Shewanella waksmanii]|uniref:hypothetical protein n=1 Tax=Shewanella waksmanii TaxID=213783 RepID=UPI0004BBCBD1|nr:hypothetical protein [Shewanella waksmanii]